MVTGSTRNNGGNANQKPDVTHVKSPWYGTADFWTALSTIMLVLVGIFGTIETKKTIALSERAWISSLGAQLVSPVQINNALKMALIFSNSGKEPAIDVNTKIDISQIIGYNVAETDMNAISVPENKSCHEFYPKEGRSVYAPNNNYQFTIDTTRADPPTFVDDAILSGRKFVVINGCVAYRTFNEEHHTSFCYIEQSFMSLVQQTQNTLSVDQQNNSNSPQNVSTRLYSMTNCPSGFTSD